VGEEIGRHFCIATELPSQRPIGALGVDQHTAKRLRAGSGAGNFLDLIDTVEGKKIDAAAPGARDLGLAFDRVSKRKTIRRNTERSAARNFTLAGQIKISASGR
jgi:hypothetical protein